MGTFMVILKPKDDAYRKKRLPLPGGIYEGASAMKAIEEAKRKFGKPADVMWCEAKEKREGVNMAHVAKWPKSGVLDKEWEKLSQITPEGVRIKRTKDPLRRNEIAAVVGSWHEYMAVIMLIIYFQRAYRRLKRISKRPTIERCYKEARREYLEVMADRPAKDKPYRMWL